MKRVAITLVLLMSALNVQSTSALSPGAVVKFLVYDCKTLPPVGGPTGKCVSIQVRHIGFILNGSGFAPNETVNLIQNCSDATCSTGTNIGTVTTDGTGAFSSSQLSVPATTADGQPYTIGTLGASGDAAYESIVPAEYTFAGFNPPLDPNHDGTVANTGKAGRTYPVKFQLQDSTGASVSDPASINLVNYSSCPATGSMGTDPIDYDVSGTTSLQYDSGSNQWMYKWKTPSTPGCYLLKFGLSDGQVYSARFSLS